MKYQTKEKIAFWAMIAAFSPLAMVMIAGLCVFVYQIVGDMLAYLFYGIGDIGNNVIGPIAAISSIFGLFAVFALMYYSDKALDEKYGK